MSVVELFKETCEGLLNHYRNGLISDNQLVNTCYGILELYTDNLNLKKSEIELMSDYFYHNIWVLCLN